jgi:hypothetical protein
MRKLAHLVAIAALMASSGCVVVSMSPLYTEKSAVFEPALVGAWNESASQQYVFSKLGENAYRIDITDRKEKSTWVGHLVRLDGVLVLDLEPSTAWAELGVPEPLTDVLDEWFVPLHFFSRIDQITPSSVSVSAVDEKWLKGYLKEHPAALAHTIRKDDVVLTASTEDIQKFLRAHLNTPGAFEEPTVMTRQK